MPDFEELLSTIGQKWIDDAFETKPSIIPELVYHYTDAAGLKGMLENGKIWATDHRFLNDKNELVHFRSAANDTLKGVMEKASSERTKALCRSALRYGEMAWTYDNFIFSLSQEADDLSQWRGYAREGRGFTLGFDAAELIKISDSVSFSCGFGKVEYNYDRQTKTLERVISDFDTELKGYLSKYKASDLEENPEDVAARTLDAVIEFRAAISKHQSFAAEKEWRLVGMVSRLEPEITVKVRTSGDRLVPYIEVGSDSSDKLPIASIGVGPGFTGPEDISAVKTLCTNCGYNPKFYFANTPYRRL